jgi:biotin carboxylase
MRTGLVHLEFRITASGPVLIEVAVRTPGGFILDAITLAYGTDMHEAAVRLALGAEPDSLPDSPRAYAACWWLQAEPGRVVEVHGLAEVRKHPAVAHADVFRRPGDVVAPLRSSADRAGYVLLAAPDPQAREAAIAETRALLHVVTEP